jgi:hypothetical protein
MSAALAASVGVGGGGVSSWALAGVVNPISAPATSAPTMRRIGRIAIERDMQRHPRWEFGKSANGEFT